MPELLPIVLHGPLRPCAVTLQAGQEFLDTELVLPSIEHQEILLQDTADRVCNREKLVYNRTSHLQRLFITHYRCHTCGYVPLYELNIRHQNRARCTRCGHGVPFKNNGKYGRLRKRIALELLGSKDIQVC